MSGGIDSMHLARHRILDAAVSEPLRVRLLVHHHVGAHGDDDEVFEEQYAHARRVADRLGLPLVGSRCSLTEAYRGMPFIHSVTPRNVNEIDLLQYLCERRYRFPAWMRPGVALALAMHGTRHSLRP